LEQLRAIVFNMKINVLLANYFSSGIDTKKDLDDYIKLFNK
jgi:CMP-2-keto-3-deoxyoctulosonic acid synthetase